MTGRDSSTSQTVEQNTSLASLFQALRWSVPLNWESANTKIKRGETGESRGGGACNHFFKQPVPVYQFLVYPLIGHIWQIVSILSKQVVLVTQKDGVWRPHAWNRGIQELNSKRLYASWGKEKESNCLVLTSSTKREIIGILHRSCAVTAKKCTKKCDGRAKLLFCQPKPIALMLFSLTSPSSLLKLPIVVGPGGRVGGGGWLALLFECEGDGHLKIKINIKINLDF